MKPACVFCPNPPTTNKGEHLFDDWLNREHGRAVKRQYNFVQKNKLGEVFRKYQSPTINTTSNVVCDACNNAWMSDITNQTKATAEGMIRHERPTTLLTLGITTLAAFTFMKAAVLDADATKDGHHPARFIAPFVCRRFAETLVPPEGVQVWMAWFRSKHLMSARAWSRSVTIRSGAFKHYRIYVFTYSVGRLALQLTYPAWLKHSRKVAPLPGLTQSNYWDQVSVPIWPNVAVAEWPPAKYLNDDNLEIFRDRFGSNLKTAGSLI